MPTVSANVLLETGLPFAMHALTSVIVTVIIAVLWRKWGRDIWYKILHKTAISNENNIPGVWTEIIQNTDIIQKQIKCLIKRWD